MPKNGCSVLATVAATADGSFGYRETAACVIASAIASQPISLVTSSGDRLIAPGIGRIKLLVGVYGVKSVVPAGAYGCCCPFGNCDGSPEELLP